MGQGVLECWICFFSQILGRPLTRFGRPARSARPCCAPHSGERSTCARARKGCAFAHGSQGGDDSISFPISKSMPTQAQQPTLVWSVSCYRTTNAKTDRKRSVAFSMVENRASGFLSAFSQVGKHKSPFIYILVVVPCKFIIPL